MPPKKIRRKVRRKKKKAGAPLGLGVLLVGLTAVNIYVFYIKKDTAVLNLLETSALSQRALQRGASAVGDDDKPVSETPIAHGADDGVDGKGAAGSRVIEGKIGKLDTLSTLLSREGFDGVALTVSHALSKVVDPRTIKPGEDYTLTFDEEGGPESFEYKPNGLDTYIVSVDAENKWEVRKEAQSLDTKVDTIAGTISSSLYGSVQSAGEAPALVSLMVDLFAWDMNFYIDTHPGDHWKVVIEKQYLNGSFYRYGRLLGAEYGGKVGTFRAFYWKDGAQEGYFDDKGQSIAKTFLKTPLRFVRISSKFDHKRMHPVLHKTRAHLGVDYAAPTGTPIWAAGSGKVVEAQMKRGSGNTVIIRHGNGYVTRYYHLSKFARGLKAGQSVNQKQVIGYVGTTGLSTGPHLHFGLTHNGGFIDPMKVKGMRDRPVARRGAFVSAIRSRIASMDKTAPQLAKADADEN